MSSGPLRLIVAGLIIVLLARAAVAAWRHRDLMLAVWRRITWRHLLGALGLLTVVATIGSLLLALPPMQIGLGHLVDFQGNAVFTPLEEAAVRAGPAPETGPDWTIVWLATAFLGFLAVLLPWLAFVEEEIFRAGLETADLGGELWTALRFGLIHMLMLVPLGAALAIAVAGFVYGRIYRTAYAGGADDRMLPPVVLRSYRPTRRARKAAAVTRLRAAYDTLVGGTAAEGRTTTLAPTASGIEPGTRQAGAVFSSTVWHTAFNSLVVALLWLAIVLEAVL